jgi:hypothetical protein
MRKIEELTSLSRHVNLVLTAALILGAQGCSVLKTRPVQEMSNTAAAINAAREVQADTLAPELFRQADEWFGKAKYEYRLKNFAMASDHAKKARRFAEQAEFESIKSGGNRTEIEKIPDSANPMRSEPPPSMTAQPEGIPADEYEQRMKAKEQKSAPNAPAPPGPSTPSAPPSLEYKTPGNEPLPEPTNL